MTFQVSSRRVKTQEPKLCPTCWNVMKENRGIWNCAKHGDPRHWTNRNRRTAPPEPKVDLTTRFPFELRQHIAPEGDRYRLTPGILEFVLKQADTGRSGADIAGQIWREAGWKSRDACAGSLNRAIRTRR